MSEPEAASASAAKPSTGAPATPREPPPPGLIEAGDGPPSDDEFLATGWDATSSKASTSVTSSIYAHAYENGRRYHSYKYGRYPIPNDDLEQDREAMKHAMMLELMVRRARPMII